MERSNAALITSPIPIGSSDCQEHDEHGAVCEDECCHVDCAKARGMAAGLCAYCGKPIGFGVRFYAEGKSLTHADCEDDAQAAS